MADYTRKLGEVFDVDNRCLAVGIDHDTVTIDDFCFTRGQMEELAQLLVAASWAAGENTERMRDTVFEPVSGASRKIGRAWCRIRPGVQGRLISYGGTGDGAFAWIDVREKADG